MLRQNHHLEFVCADVAVRVERCDNPWLAACAVGDELVIPVKHGEGAWYADDDLVAQLGERGQLVLRYGERVNGATGDVAGVTNARGNVLGLMPHPEHAVDPLLGPTGGRPILSALVTAAHNHARAAAVA